MPHKNRRSAVREYHNHAFMLWCKTISIRGMSKLVRGPRLLRSAWFIYVVGMTTFLALVVAYLVSDYLKYDFTVQTRILLDNPSPFPAFTVCHQHPFSDQGFQLWDAGKIMSPMKFNEIMKKLLLKYIKEKRFEAAKIVGLQDAVSLYFQSLNSDEVHIVGHNSTIFRSCIRKVGSALYHEQNCLELQGFKLTVHPHPKYFNCHTFEPVDEEAARETDSLSLILGMGPLGKDEYTMEKTFLTSIFDQKEGLRVAVHEIGTYPDLIEYGLNVEPGKLNEITYTPTKRIRLHVSNRPCRAKNKSFKYKLMNVEQFNYTQDLCLKLQVQNEIIKDCKCIYSMYPSEQAPTKDIPYCERLYPDFYREDWEKRKFCLQSKEISQMKRKYNGNPCVPNCEHYEYPHTISTTKWHIHDWQLYWLSKLREAIESLKGEYENDKEIDIEKAAAFEAIAAYISPRQNLTDIPKENKSKIEEEKDYAFVVLKRLKNSTTEKTDKLNLSMAILWSRIGGLCSITIGLTAAVLFEMLEFAYQLYKESKARSQMSGNYRHSRADENNSDDFTISNRLEEEMEPVNSLRPESALYQLHRTTDGLYLLKRATETEQTTNKSIGQLLDNGNGQIIFDKDVSNDLYRLTTKTVSDEAYPIENDFNITPDPVRPRSVML